MKIEKKLTLLLLTILYTSCLSKEQLYESLYNGLQTKEHFDTQQVDHSFNEIERAGTGAAIEWFSPVGPIMFIFSRPLMEKAGDSTTSFEFTIGRMF